MDSMGQICTRQSRGKEKIPAVWNGGDFYSFLQIADEHGREHQYKEDDRNPFGPFREERIERTRFAFVEEIIRGTGDDAHIGFVTFLHHNDQDDNDRQHDQQSTENDL